MRSILETKTAKARDAAHAFLETSEAFAMTLAREFDAGSRIKLGPVRQRRHGASFDLVGIADGAILPVSILIPRNIPETEVWATWALALGLPGLGGLSVDTDAGYEASLGA